MEGVTSEYENQLSTLREMHRNYIEQLSNDQKTMIDNLRQAKAMEVNMMQESSSYLSTLKNASSRLESAGENLETMRQTIDTNVGLIHNERGMQLEAREKRLEGNFHYRFNCQQTNLFLRCSRPAKSYETDHEPSRGRKNASH